MLYSILIWISIAYLLIFFYLIWRAASLRKKNLNEESKKN